MTGKRTRYSAEFKAKVALEALRWGADDGAAGGQVRHPSHDGWRVEAPSRGGDGWGVFRLDGGAGDGKVDGGGGRRPSAVAQAAQRRGEPLRLVQRITAKDRQSRQQAGRGERLLHRVLGRDHAHLAVVAAQVAGMAGSKRWGVGGGAPGAGEASARRARLCGWVGSSAWVSQAAASASERRVTRPSGTTSGVVLAPASRRERRSSAWASGGGNRAGSGRRVAQGGVLPSSGLSVSTVPQGR